MKGLTKRDNCDKLTSILFVVVKLKIFKFLRTNSTSMSGPYLVCFLLISPQYVVPFSSNFDPPPWYPLKDDRNRKKNIPTLKKISYRTIQVYQNQGPFSSPFYGKNRFIFCIFGLKTGEHHRSNGQNENLTQLISLKWLWIN